MRRGHAARKRAGERVLYPLLELCLLWRLVAGVSHGPAALADPLLHAGLRPADAALREAEAEHGSAVDRVLLRVAHELEGDRPRPGNGDEHEPALVEDRLRRRVLWPHGIVIDRIIRVTFVAAMQQSISVQLLEDVRSEGGTYSRAMGSATSA